MSAKHQNQQAFLAKKQPVMATQLDCSLTAIYIKPKASKHSTKPTLNYKSQCSRGLPSSSSPQFPETMTILVRTSDGSWVVVEETLDRPEQSSPGGIDDGFASEDQSSLRTAALTRDPQNKSRKEMDT